MRSAADVSTVALIRRVAAAAMVRAANVALGAASYDISVRDHRTRAWNPGLTNGNAELALDGPLARARAYDLARNNPHARRVRQAAAARVIGSGLWPESDDPEWNKLFERWAVHCYTANRSDFCRVQWLAFDAMFDGGLSVTRRRYRMPADLGWDGQPLPVPLKLQLLEADQVDRTRDGPTATGGEIVEGFEFSNIGEPTGGWFFKSHPGDPFLTTTDSTFVQYMDLAPLFDEDRPGVVGGAPWLSPVARRLRSLDRYESAEGDRKYAESCTVGVVEDAIGEDDEEDSDADNRTAPAVVNRKGEVVETWKPLQLLYAIGGKTIKFHTPSPTQGYREFITTVLHAVAAGLSLPYYAVSGDLSQTTYASARIGDVDSRAWVRPFQRHVVIPFWCNPVATWFTSTAILSGTLKPKPRTIRWILPAVEPHDRMEQSKADVFDIRNGLAARSDIQRSRGDRPMELLDRIQQDNQDADDRYLVLDSDPRRTSQAGALQADRGAPTDTSETSPH